MAEFEEVPPRIDADPESMERGLGPLGTLLPRE